MMTSRPDVALTRRFAAFVVEARAEQWPEAARREAPRAFLNHMGCALGGCREPAVEAACAVAAMTGGGPQASIIGRDARTDIVNAAFINCLSSAALAYDDTHLATVTHPTGPVAAALFAYAEHKPVTGEEFLIALTLGVEIQCRLSNVLLLAPAKANLSLYITGVTGPVGAAAALARVMNLDPDRTCAAMGLAAAQAAGFRATHGSMAGAFPPAHAARAGMLGALLAQRGFACSDAMIEGPKGLIEIFATDADPGLAVAGLGEQFEMLANAYKPYPAGIVVQPAIDACLDIAAQAPPGWGGAIADVRLDSHPLALMLADRPDPADLWEAQVSLQHWAAAALLRGRAGVAELRDACLRDPAVAALRRRVTAFADSSLGRDEARAVVTMADGATLRAHVRHARGSASRPMTDDELDAKFLAQAETTLSNSQSRRLLTLCRDAAALADVGGAVASIWR